MSYKSTYRHSIDNKVFFYSKSFNPLTLYTTQKTIIGMTYYFLSFSIRILVIYLHTVFESDTNICKLFKEGKQLIRTNTQSTEINK